LSLLGRSALNTALGPEILDSGSEILLSVRQYVEQFHFHRDMTITYYTG
jgi:hypothetical protein